MKHCIAPAVSTLIQILVLMTGSSEAQEYLLQPPVPPRASCNSLVNQGGDAPETHSIDISGTVGSVEFQYDTAAQPDRMLVAIDSVTVFDTTCVGTNGFRNRTLSLPAGAQKLQIRVMPNCNGGTGTVWAFKVVCPTTK
jgi:hypothetical protein